MGKQQYKSKNGRGKKPFIKKEFDKDKVAVEEFQENDWTWYAANEQLLRDAASIQFSNSLGMDNPNGLQNIFALKNTVPGIMTIEMLPTVGHSEDPSSPVNVAAKNINSWVRHANSGSRNYESSDIMMTLLATSSVYAYIAMLERLYGLARVYSQQNRYMAKTMLSAQVGPTIAADIIDNLADFRYAINQVIIKASTLKIPKGLSVVDRHIWLNSHVWADDTSAKAQVYIPLIKYFYKYVPTKFTTGGSLEYTTFPTTGGYLTLITIVNSMIDVLVRDDDINTIWGDIIKAYGDEGCYKLASLPEEYAVVPEYSIEVLEQISNAMCLGSAVLASNADAVVQYNNYLISFPEAYFTTNELTLLLNDGYNSTLIDIPHDNPTVADNMVASRLMVFGDPNIRVNTGLSPSEIGTLEPYSTSNGIAYNYGTELVTGIKITRVPTEASENIMDTVYYASGSFVDLQSAVLPTQVLAASLITKFKHFPRIVYFDSTGGTCEYLGVIGELDNYTTLTYHNIMKLNNTALLNEFAVPQLGVVKR